MSQYGFNKLILEKVGCKKSPFVFSPDVIFNFLNIITLYVQIICVLHSCSDYNFFLNNKYFRFIKATEGNEAMEVWAQRLWKEKTLEAIEKSETLILIKNELVS